MKHSQIGTIMAWSGDASSGFTASNIPKGWILCDGKQYTASQYPLLASIIGITYGGNNDLPFAGSFPEYKDPTTNQSDTFRVPNLTAKVMMDMDSEYLSDSRYYAGQSDAFSQVGSLLSKTGNEVTINPIVSSDTDLDFSITGTTYIGKLSMVSGSTSVANTLNPAAYQSTTYVIPRKLGQNHMPTHSHRASSANEYQSVQNVGTIATFSPPNVVTSGKLPEGCGNTSAGFNQIDIANANAHPWTNGRAQIAYYDPNSLVFTDRFYDFPNNMNAIPGSGYNYLTNGVSDGTVSLMNVPSDASGQVNAMTGITPATTHAEPAWTGSFPVPSIIANRKNYAGNVSPNSFTAISASATAASGAVILTLSSGTDMTNIKPKMFVYTTPSGSSFGGLARGTMVTDVDRVAKTVGISQPTTASLSGTTVYFKQGTFPTTQNNVIGTENPSSSSFGSHNHGSIDLQMNLSSLRPPSTFTINNISLGDVAPINFPKALNLTVNKACPALNIVYIIRAY